MVAPRTYLHIPGPSPPAELQASQAPAQARLQQTPSAQCPEPHWEAVSQGAPSPGFGVEPPVSPWAPPLLEIIPPVPGRLVPPLLDTPVPPLPGIAAPPPFVPAVPPIAPELGAPAVPPEPPALMLMPPLPLAKAPLPPTAPAEPAWPGASWLGPPSLGWYFGPSAHADATSAATTPRIRTRRPGPISSPRRGPPERQDSKLIAEGLSTATSSGCLSSAMSLSNFRVAAVPLFSHARAARASAPSAAHDRACSPWTEGWINAEGESSVLRTGYFVVTSTTSSSRKVPE